MARKKIKRSATQTKLVPVAAMEKAFRETPAKLAALYRKDAMLAKQQEKKLAQDIKNAQAQHKISAKSHDGLTNKNAKPSAAAKKRIVKSKKKLDALTKSIAVFNKQLDQVKKQVHLLSAKQNKFATLGKQLVKLEKEIELQAKAPAKTKSPIKSSKKPASKVKPAAPVKIESTPAADIQETTILEPAEMDS